MTVQHLFSPEGEAALAATMARRPLLAFDFDGTLAPIVARPDDARVPLPVARRLDRLAAKLPVAIISGRSIDDVKGRLSFKPRWIIGSHGAEDPHESSPTSAAALEPMRERLAREADALAAAGVTVEDKAQSIALHYRLARDRDRALGLIEQVIAAPGPGVESYGGKCVMNLVPADAPNKAHAVARLVERAGVECAVFVGDDVNDEPVFARAEPSWLTIKVGREDPNTRARFCVDSPAEVASMLDRMLMRLQSAEEGPHTG